MNRLKRLATVICVFVFLCSIGLPVHPAHAQLGSGQAVSASQSSNYLGSDLSKIPADGVQTALIIVVVRSSSGTLLPSKSVTLTATFSGTGLTITPSLATTDSNGSAFFYVKSKTAGVATFYATVSGVTVSQTSTVTFVNLVSDTLSDFSVSPQTVVADGSQASTVTVTAKDLNGNVVSGRPVTITSGLSGVTITPNTGYTDSSGRTSFSIRSLSVGSAILHATVDGVSLKNTYSVSFIPMGSAVSPTLSVVTASKSVVVANGNNYVQFMATIRDKSGSAISGKTVVFTIDLNGNISKLTYVSDSQGQAGFATVPTNTGTQTVTAVVDDVALNQVSVSFVSTNYPDFAVSPEKSDLYAYPTTLSLGSTVKLTITAHNAAGQALSNKAIQIQTSNVPFTSTPSTAYTDANGVGTVVLKPSTGGNFFLTVKVDGVQLFQQPYISVSGGSLCPYAIGTNVKLPDDGNSKTQYDSAVYYYGADCYRHPYPNAQAYFSWFTNFNNVKVVSSNTMASMPLGKNVIVRPGSRMVKFGSIPKVYMVSKGGILRWVTTEALAQQYFGSNWTTKVVDVPDVFYTNYGIGTDIKNVWDYNVGDQYSQASLDD